MQKRATKYNAKTFALALAARKVGLPHLEKKTQGNRQPVVLELTTHEAGYCACRENHKENATCFCIRIYNTRGGVTLLAKKISRKMPLCLGICSRQSGFNLFLNSKGQCHRQLFAVEKTPRDRGCPKSQGKCSRQPFA